MATTKIGPKHQITIPRDVFERLRLETGDLLEALVEGGKIVFVPKRLAEKAPAATLTQAEQQLLARAKRKLERIRADLTHSKGLTDEEARLAARAGLIAEDQIWWWTEEWQKKEREAERELRAGKGRGPFTTARDMLADLNDQARASRKKNA